MNEAEKAFEVFRVGEDPESLTQFVHRVKDRVNPDVLVESLERAVRLPQGTEEARRIAVDVRFGTMLSLGEFKYNDILPELQNGLRDLLLDWYQNDPSSAIHGAAGWLLRRWKFDEEVSEVDHTVIPYDKSGVREWFVVRIDTQEPGLLNFFFGRPKSDYFTFVVFRPGTFSKGSPESEIDRVKVN